MRKFLMIVLIEMLPQIAWANPSSTPLLKKSDLSWIAGGAGLPHDTDDRFETEFGKHLSFPSGHTASAFAGATTLSFQYPRWYVILPSYGLAGIVGGSRLTSNNHWLSDVTVGALIGTGISVLVHRIKRVQRNMCLGRFNLL
jgi:membrane-associated phospholipid phosphatase